MAQSMEARLHFTTAKELFQALPAIEEDIRARPANETALDFLGLLRASATPEEAITYSAYLLPRRQAVWWGHQCVKRLAHLLTDQDLAMLDLARDWVVESDEPQRWRALTQALAARNKTPGVWICLAAGWSGGSLAPPEAPRVAPMPFLTPRALNTGIQAALAKVETANRAKVLDGFVDGCIAMVTR